MIADGQLTETNLETMRKSAQDSVQEATEWALAQPYPPVEAVMKDIWA
jgi:TPP-dependent pyruvate/acetoin dehydrogenase alpha subunit